MKKIYFVSLLFISTFLFAEVKLPHVLADNMVLQRQKPISIWGFADAGERVEVTVAGKTLSTKADSQGDWLLKFPAQKANSRAQEIKIKGKNEIILKNILIGDVWLGSGQSNMEWTLLGTENGKAVAAKAKHPKIRLFHVRKHQRPQVQKDVTIAAPWSECKPNSVQHFSAVLYYFGRKLQKEVGVPIGLINSSWGGSAIQPWLAHNGQMYNSMIAPLHNFALKGITWYQGETNVLQRNGLKYFDLKKELIEGWRQKWTDEELPFYFAQIAPWQGKYLPGELPALWEAQCKTLSLPRTGMCVTTDIVHNITDIHPINKVDVGERLARWALAKDYGKKIVYSGPLYKSMKISGSKIIITFAHAGGGLKVRQGRTLTEFQIAGADGQFVPAIAKISGETVIVSAKSIKKPKNVRFGWHALANPNLMNKEKLPASPFQTDNWQGATGE